MWGVKEMKSNFINIQLFAEQEDVEAEEIVVDDIEDVETEEVEATEEIVDTEADELPEEADDEDIEVVIEDDDEETEAEEKDEQTEEVKPQEEPEETPIEEAKPNEDKIALEKQVKETLEALGINVDGSIEDALMATAAEAKGISVEDYKAEKATQAAIQIQKQRQIEEMLAADLIELKKAVPSLVDLDHISKINNFAEFGAMRDKGLTVKQAYMAVNGDKLTSSKQAVAKQEAIAKSKEHLQTVTQKKAADAEKLFVPKSEWTWLRDMFPNKTDSQLARIYKNAKN